MMKCVSLLLLSVLVGCQQIGGQVALDATQAVAMASAFAKYDPGAPGRAACYQAFGAVGANAAGVRGIAILSAVEGGIEFQTTMQRSECQAIMGQISMWLLRHAPVGNILP